MSYRLFSDVTDYSTINEEQLKNELKELKSDKADFLVLEQTGAEIGVIYVQTAKNDDVYQLEGRYVNSDKSYTHYGMEASFEQVTETFLDYIRGFNPDFTRSCWEKMDI